MTVGKRWGVVVELEERLFGRDAWTVGGGGATTALTTMTKNNNQQVCGGKGGKR